MDVTIGALGSTDDIAELAELLIDVVAHGGSVSFMHPLSLAKAREFWSQSLQATSRGERVLIGARIGQRLIATVTLQLACPENQPHRGEIAKLMTHSDFRGRGIARSLLREAERIAREHARTLLVLDTATDGGAAPLYEGLGYVRVGVIPDYALKPHGGLSGTAIYYKKLLREDLND